jgi:hypothetical protein
MTQDTSWQEPRSGTQVLLRARSATEAQLYLDLHPCGECGTPRPRGSQELRQGGDGRLTSVHAGACPGCGRGWNVAFSLPASPLPAGLIGGAEPSAIIDPGEWLVLSDRDASVLVSSGPLGPEDRARLARAADEIAEVAKFIPAGRDRVPEEAFTSTVGRAMRAAVPGRFLGADLTDRARLYRAGARPGHGRRAASTRD